VTDTEGDRHEFYLELDEARDLARKIVAALKLPTKDRA
jgi:hypothetical protein